jgi:peptidoglycan/xylan/chitin deacetylase (PgdA/CDA1 family)
VAAKIILIWDYDTPLTTITATKPYNYDFKASLQESNDVDTILTYSQEHQFKFTFATLGFGAEKTVYPFDVRDKIKKIHTLGHEIASHSWKHEWFPHLTKYQIQKSLERSKLVLEECIGLPGSVKGFVPPHDRPTSWPSRFAFSLEDRAIYPFHPGASIGFILEELKRQKYGWCRVSYRPIWKKIFDWKGSDFEVRLKKSWQVSKGILHFQGTYSGFDEPLIRLIDVAIKKSLPIVIVGHPAALSRNKTGNIKYFDNFINYLVPKVKSGDAITYTVYEYIKTAGLLPV